MFHIEREKRKKIRRSRLLHGNRMEIIGCAHKIRETNFNGTCCFDKSYDSVMRSLENHIKKTRTKTSTRRQVFISIKMIPLYLNFVVKFDKLSIYDGRLTLFLLSTDDGWSGRSEQAVIEMNEEKTKCKLKATSCSLMIAMMTQIQREIHFRDGLWLPSSIGDRLIFVISFWNLISTARLMRSASRSKCVKEDEIKIF